MRSFIVGSVAALSLFLFANAAFAMSQGENFVCGTAKIDSCSCQGTTDCRDMRRSGICNGPMTCHNGTCTCGTTNAITKPKLNGISGVGSAGMRPVMGTTAPQSRPVVKFKPLLPVVKPMRTK